MADYAHAPHDEDNSPAWGTLPLDIYLLENWNPHSTISDDDQRHHLVRNSLAAGHKGRVPYAARVNSETVVDKRPAQPTAEQTATVLQPLRAPGLRSAALHLSTTVRDFVWLRTDYNDDEQHQALIDDVNEADFGETLSDGGVVLSDRRYYDVGSQWQRVLEFLPEILSSANDAYPRGSEDATEQDIKDAHAEEDRKIQEIYVDWKRACDEKSDEELDEALEFPPPESTRADKEVLLYAQKTFKHDSGQCERHLYVEDEDTYTSDPKTFLVLWLNGRGDVVRYNRMDAEAIGEYLCGIPGASWMEHPCFQFATIGDDYLPGGKNGPALSS